jgi:hypothetical protein
MTAEEFIAALRVVVRDAAVKDSLATIEHPPGRKPSMELQKASAWYRSLDKDQQAILASVIGEAVDSAIFGFLCVLDGVRAVENGERKGRFELHYIGERAIWLNAEDKPMLHDLYNARST